MQKWEYLTINRESIYHYNKGILPGIGDSGYYDWQWTDDCKENWDERLNLIGEDGWELVSVLPISFGLGESGRTTQVRLIFKRQK